MTTPRLSFPLISPTDTPQPHVDINTALDDIDDKVLFDMQGVISSRPAAGVVGRYYTATDQLNTLYRDNGTSWDQLYPPKDGSVTKSMLPVDILTGATTYSGGAIYSPPNPFNMGTITALGILLIIIRGTMVHEGTTGTYFQLRLKRDSTVIYEMQVGNGNDTTTTDYFSFHRIVDNTSGQTISLERVTQAGFYIPSGQLSMSYLKIA